ncbi:MAG: hypothetical protein C4530_09950 [Desulfobacteraceae bacterium]|nr:MAG: hypothetical protein C4530_09950 [Desulfobacteraceae bacterium]
MDRNLEWIGGEFFKRIDDEQVRLNIEGCELTITGMQAICNQVIDASKRHGMHDMKTRLQAARDVIAVVTAKLKFAGVLDGDDGSGGPSLKSLLEEIDGQSSGVPGFGHKNQVHLHQIASILGYVENLCRLGPPHRS